MVINEIHSVTEGLAKPVSYFIDIECDVEMASPQLRRINIPRRLALYIKELQDDNVDLRKRLDKLGGVVAD